MSQIYPGEMGIQVKPPAISESLDLLFCKVSFISAVLGCKKADKGHLAKLVCDDVPLLFIAVFAIELLFATKPNLQAANLE